MSSLKVQGFVLECHQWLASPEIDNMTGDQVKAFMRLLARSWLEIPRATLPNNDQHLARIAGLLPDQWQSLKPAILAMFESHEDSPDRIFNPDLMTQSQSLEQRKLAGASGWTQKRKLMMGNIARENGAKHTAKNDEPKREPKRQPKRKP